MNPQNDNAGQPLALDRPQVMGILNVTPDSFSDGGLFVGREQAVAHARKMYEEGADMIDIGGESTRPGAQPVSADEELERVVPLIEIVASEIPLPISVDTSKPEVMRAAVAAGATFINDVNALRNDGALAVAAELRVPVCLMHMQGEPRSMQIAPDYEDVTADVMAFLGQRIAACEAVGIDRERIVVDPGFGFGKGLQHNLSLLRHLDDLHSLGCPLLVGISRKSMLGAILDVPVERRLYGSLAAAVMAASKGAALLRVHDVRPTVEALEVVKAVMAAK